MMIRQRETVRITEVGPRDGLQNQSARISTDVKVAFVDALSTCGFAEIEVSSFVSPKWVPQLGDATEVFARIRRRSGILYSALVPNERGLDAALEARVDKVAVFTAASETFSQKNTNATIAQTLERFGPVVKRAKSAGLPVRAYVSCVVACPYEGPIGADQVRGVVESLQAMGCNEIDLGDTIGVAEPADIERLYDGLRTVIEPGESTLHLHDTQRRAAACLVKAIELGVRSFDASLGGLGGCPYAPGAAGNVATEDVVRVLEGAGFTTGIDLDGCRRAREVIERHLERPFDSRFEQTA